MMKSEQCTLRLPLMDIILPLDPACTEDNPLSGYVIGRGSTEGDHLCN